MSAAASKAVLRDCRRRLIGLRKECGIEDEQEATSTGDPFADLVVAYQDRVRDVNNLIDDETSTADGDGKETAGVRAQVDAGLLRLERDLEELNNMVYQAEAAYARAEIKKKKASKISKRRVIYEQQKMTFQECQSMYISSKKLRDEVRRGKIKRPPVTKATKTRVKQLAMASSVLAQGNRQAADIARNAPFGVDTVDLRTDAETKAIMREIDEEKKKIDKGLQNLVKQVQALRQLAHKIGDEIDSQAQTVESLASRIDSTTESVQTVTQMQNQLIEASSPLNTCVNVFCFVMLLGLVGYLLWKFGVVG